MKRSSLALVRKLVFTALVGPVVFAGCAAGGDAPGQVVGEEDPGEDDGESGPAGPTNPGPTAPRLDARPALGPDAGATARVDAAPDPAGGARDGGASVASVDDAAGESARDGGRADVTATGTRDGGPATGTRDGGAVRPTGMPDVVDAGSAGGLHFVVYGDTRTNAGTHKNILGRISQLHPELVVHTGDLWDGYGQGMFLSLLRGVPGISALLDQGRYVVARGNHETTSEYLGFKPSLSRGNKGERFSFLAGNSFFVILGMDSSGAAGFLDQELSKPEARAATWRFVASHYPIYSGGEHGARGLSAIEQLCDKHHVAIYWNGHDHIYERSQQVFGRKVVDTSNALIADRGTVYVVAGGGGAPLYRSTKIPTTHTNMSSNSFIDVSAGAAMLTVTTYNGSGNMIDLFTISR